MAKTAAELIASLNSASGLDGLYSVLRGSKALKDPFRESMKRLTAITEQYGPNMEKYPADVKREYDDLCLERDRHDALQDEQLRFEAKKRL